METPEPSVLDYETYDMLSSNPIRRPPTVHVARGYQDHLPFLNAGRAVICISDWQVEPATQRHFWEQVMTILVDEIGADLVASALVLVAGDMASSSNALRGTKSDAPPDISWLRESIPDGDVLVVYGNHDLAADEHFAWRNSASGLPCLLPHGAALQVGLTAVATAPADQAAAGREVQVAERAEAPAAAAPAPSPAESAPASSPGAPKVQPTTDEDALAAADAGSAATEPTETEAAWRVPTPQQLTGLTKQQRAALWAGSGAHERKRAAPTKSERQWRQHAAQFPHEAYAAERLRELHSGRAALRLPLDRKSVV